MFNNGVGWKKEFEYKCPKCTNGASGVIKKPVTSGTGRKKRGKTCNIKQNINANIIKDANDNNVRTAKRGRVVEEDSGETTKRKIKK